MPKSPKGSPSNYQQPQVNMFAILVPYKWYIGLLILFSLLSNGLTLLVPKLIAIGIDTYTAEHMIPRSLLMQFVVVAIAVFGFSYLQSVVQTYASELAGRDFRRDITEKLSKQTFSYIQQVTSSVLLTNLTSDVDAIKGFIAQAIPSIFSSAFLIIGASILLLITDWKLALLVLLIVPIIGVTFAMVLGKVRVLFLKAQGVIDHLNKVINESILGAALIRVLNSQAWESKKFDRANTDSRDLGLSILNYFAVLIPVITFVASLASLTILVVGGKFVIDGSMTLGDFAAFMSYVTILIFPIIMIGFMSNVIARSSASYGRVLAVLQTKEKDLFGTVPSDLSGSIEVKNLELKYGEKEVLKDLSFTIKPKTRTAIIGPTAAGKSQLINVLSGLVDSTGGNITFSGTDLHELDKDSFYQQLGLVFQDSSVFNMSVKENIAFNKSVNTLDLQKAIKTAELSQFVDSLPDGLDTVVSERGSSLSGGQKQRLMLARALSLEPKVLLLDDFTARVDSNTEALILKNIKNNYPSVTLISVTQKIASVEDYDQIIMLMEGEIVAIGTHTELLKSSPEYAQLYDSQRSTNTYEVHT